MKWRRRGQWAVVAGIAVLVFQGCYVPVHRKDLEAYKELGKLNEQQGLMITDLRGEQGILRKENTRLAAAVQEKDAYIGEQMRVIQRYDKIYQELSSYRDYIKKMLSASKEIEDVQQLRTDEGYVYRMEGGLLFRPGSAKIAARGKKALAQIAERLKKNKHPIRISGFTDSQPIKMSGFDSNLELSGRRAYAVLKALKDLGVSESRMHFAGFGEFKLITGAAGKEDKKKSRRVEVLVLVPMSVQTRAAGK